MTVYQVSVKRMNLDFVLCLPMLKFRWGKNYWSHYPVHEGTETSASHLRAAPTLLSA